MDYDYQEKWEDEQSNQSKKDFLDFTIRIENEIERIQSGIEQDGLNDFWRGELDTVKDDILSFKDSHPNSDIGFLFKSIDELYQR